jgi:hypothetical protein
MKKLSIVLLVAMMCGCYKTENGLVFGIPGYEKRDVQVSQVDLDILNKTNQLLSDEHVWEKQHPSDCTKTEKLDLFCALEKASIDVMGKYIHRKPALQEVRFAIDDNYKNRWSKHRLIDFNSNKDTNFDDVKSVLEMAISAVKMKITHNKSLQTPKNGAAEL